jgi:hypothetical protein
MPVTIQRTSLQSLSIQLPILQVLHCMASKRWEALPAISIRIDGIHVEMRMDEARQWRWKLAENKDRFTQAVSQAHLDRLALANTWTATVIDKLAKLAAPPPKKKTISSSNNASKPSSVLPPILGTLVDALVDGFNFSLSNVHIAMLPYTADMALSLELGDIRVYPAIATSPEKKCRSRALEMVRVGLSAQPVHASSSVNEYLLKPFTIKMHVEMPPCSHFLNNADNVGKVLVQITWPALDFAIRPRQLYTIHEILKPMNDHGIWLAQAKRHDESACAPLLDKETYLMLIQQQHAYQQYPWYKRLAGKLRKIFDGLHDRFLNRHTKNGAAAAAIDGVALQEQQRERIEATLLPLELLMLRSEALQWNIPSFGSAFPYVSKELKAVSDMMQFIITPLDHYQSSSSVVERVQEKMNEDMTPHVPPKIQSLELRLEFGQWSFTTYTTIDASHSSLRPCLELYMHHLHLAVTVHSTVTTMTTTPLNQDETKNGQNQERYWAVEALLEIERFGVMDCRQDRNNLFPHIVACNPDCTSMLRVSLTRGTTENSRRRSSSSSQAHHAQVVRESSSSSLLDASSSSIEPLMTICVELSNFSTLVIFTPVFDSIAALAPMWKDDEETLIWKDEDDVTNHTNSMMVPPTQAVYEEATAPSSHVNNNNDNNHGGHV